MFEYYKEKPSKGESPKGQLNLEDCRAVNSGLNHNKHKFVFSVELRDRTYYLVAGSEEEMKSWVSTLCLHCGFSTPRGEDLTALCVYHALCCGCFVLELPCISVVKCPANGLTTVYHVSVYSVPFCVFSHCTMLMVML